MAILAEKVAEFPENMPDWEIANILNAPDPTLPQVWKLVPTAHARGYLMAFNGHWGDLKDARGNSNLTQTVRRVADKMYDALNMQDSIDLTNETYRTVVQNDLDTLVQAGVLTQAAKDGLLNLGKRKQSWAEANGVEVTARTVGLARGAKE